MKKIFSTALFFALLPFVASAYDFCVDGIYYNRLSDTECEVTYHGTSQYEKEAYDIESVAIPSSVNNSGYSYTVTGIGEWAFFESYGLQSITLPNSVTRIGRSAFALCYDLRSINIPDSLISIGWCAFSSCNGLETITLPNTVTSIGKGAFSDCNNLTSITLPNSLTSIGEEAFSNCPKLASITIPDSVTSIGDGAFSCCFCLKSITLPNSLTRIGDDTFNSCASLQSITLPNSVTSIGERAFTSCGSLPSITLSKSLTSIGVRAFFQCVSLATIICNCETPPSLSVDVFYSSPKETLMVPQGCLEAYQNAEGWTEFKNIIENTTEISAVRISPNESDVMIYNVNGIRADKLQHGIQLMRKADGSVEKVITINN